jgi:hypothetical protein
MRSAIIPILIGIGALITGVGCEDGPNQNYNPSPAGAAGSWNNPDASLVTPQAGQLFDAGYPTNSKVSLCSTDLKRQRWAWMLTQPIVPPRGYAGIDLAKSDNWEGLRIDDAEQPPTGDVNSPGGGLCQTTPTGFEGGCPSGLGSCNGAYWGNNQEVSLSWNVSTHLIDQMFLSLGYTGKIITKKYPDHNGESHAYTIGIGDVIRRDGAAFEIAWTGDYSAQVTDIFNATMATFGKPAGVAFDDSVCSKDTDCSGGEVCQCVHDKTNTANCASPAKSQCGAADCTADGNCLAKNDGANTYMGFRPLVVYVLGTSGVPQPALSTPIGIYNFFSKTEPYSSLPQQVKLDADGPIAQGKPSGQPAGGTKICKQEIGQTFGDLVTNCVQVHGDVSNPKGVDAVNLNKLLFGLSHDQEHYTANVLGVNQNFTKANLDPTKVVADADKPEKVDIAQDWTFDTRARGAVQNDNTPTGDLDLRGTRLVFIEWARLMLNDIGRILGKAPRKLGDPVCTGFKANGSPVYESVPGGSGAAKGCSGIEGLMVPFTGAGDDFSKDPVGDPAANSYDVHGSFYSGSVLKPGDVTGAFCIDPVNQTDCTTSTGLSLWFNALNHVTRVLGDGDPNALPAELRDRRYYYYWWGVAYTKYLKTYGTFPAAKRDLYPDGTPAGGPGPSDVAKQDIDLESFFFDYAFSGGGQTFDKFEYIDRDFIGVGAGGPGNPAPWDFEYGADTKGGNQRYDNWYRRMDREEIALYAAMLTDKSKTPGFENNVNITNLFGSDVLAGLYGDITCATGVGGVDAKGNLNCTVNPPLDPTGATSCAVAACTGGKKCVHAATHEVGKVAVCGAACDFTAHPTNGCALANQTCVHDSNADGSAAADGGCVTMASDLNAPGSKYAKPLLSYYEGAFSRTPFSKGHSPITLKAADKQPKVGVTKITIPNFKDGPYTFSPVLANQDPMAMAPCDAGYTQSANKIWCNAALNAGTGTLAPSFTPLTPWLEVKSGTGFSIPIDGQRFQQVTTGQLDFTGVLETYIVDYLPFIDVGKPSCISDNKCNPGFVCDTASANCVTDDDTISIAAIEGADFLGESFVCVDPASQDVLHVRMYDSALAIVDWLAAHPGDSFNPSAQQACQIIVARTPYDNYVDYVVSKQNGVLINVGLGDGQGRVTDIVLFDTSYIQAL